MYKILLCVRYLRTRYIALASIISVMLGVATMIVVNSVMAGFSTEMRDRIHAILADVVIETRSTDGAPHSDLLMERAREAVGEHIKAMSATVEVIGMLSYRYGDVWMNHQVHLVGIDPDSKATVGPLVDSLQSYKPVLEGGKVVGPPRRQPHEHPDWNLSEAGRERRRRIAEQRMLFGTGHDPLDLPAAVPQPFNGPFEESAPQTSATPVQAGSLAEGGSLAANGAGGNAAATTNDGAVQNAAGQPEALNPFHQEAEVTEATGEPVDLEAALNEIRGVPDAGDPLPARVYVGAGLIEYAEPDPETGEVRIYKLVEPGDDVRISTVTAGSPPKPAYFPATVVDVFKSGMSEYDSSLVFCNIEELQRVRGMTDNAITSIQIVLKDYENAPEVVEKLRQAFPLGSFNVHTWEQKQGPLLEAVEVEKAILNVLLFLIIAVAGFGILAIFFMIVVEKTRDIGIMKSLGASSRGVMTIFLSYGLALGIVGSGVGVALGLTFVHYINEIEDAISWVIGRKVFSETIYYFKTIPTAVSPWMVFLVALGAIAIAVLASILPALRAARLHPVEALRYE